MPDDLREQLQVIADEQERSLAWVVEKACRGWLAERAKAAGFTRVVFDRGGYLYHGRVAAFAEGAREGGLEF